MNTYTPVITDMKVVPVAGYDSMLLNIGGAHSAFFTRNIVVLTDSAGHTGLGEAPGGETIYQTLTAAIPQVVGHEVARMNRLVQQVHKGNQHADFDTFGKGARPLSCASTRWRRWNRRCSICSASFSACRWRSCSAPASSATR